MNQKHYKKFGNQTNGFSKPIRIVFVKTPQTMLMVGKEIYSNRRAYNPEPTLPLLKALAEQACRELGIPAEAINLDLRDDRIEGFGRIKIGEMRIPYIERSLDKIIHGIEPPKSGRLKETVKSADVIGFSSNFAANANSVAYYMKELLKINPKAEIWVGGADASVKERWNFYFSRGADVIFRGEVFDSLRKYLAFRFSGQGKPINVVTREGESRFEPMRFRHGSTYSIPFPSLPEKETLSKFSECAEGPFPGKQEDFIPAVYTHFTKGCTGNCPFCTTWLLRPCFRQFNLKTLEKHLDHYKRSGVKTLIMMEDSFLNLLKLPGYPPRKATERINAIMRRINDRGFNVEFGNGLELRLLLKHWDSIHREMFRNCFRVYTPLEDLAYAEGDKPAYEKLMHFDHEIVLLKKIIALRKKGFPLRQLTFGFIVGKPSDTEEGLRKTVERAKQIKELFKGSDIEIAFTPYCNSFLPGTVDFAKYHKKLTLKDLNEHPELLCYSMVSNRTKHISDPKKIWKAWLEIMNLNPHKVYLKSFRKNGAVSLSRVK